jgi:hypothetical protein
MKRKTHCTSISLKKIAYKKGKIMLMQNFLSNCDDKKSTMYQQGLKDYEKRRNEHNTWLKKPEIIKRLSGIKTLTVGTLSPNFTLQDSDNPLFNLHEYKSTKPYKLVIFWSADCNHCLQVVDELTKWTTDNGSKIEIIAVSLDETDTELAAWNEKKKSLTGWKHLNPVGGISSKVANDYFILSTPSIFLIDYSDNKIQFIPKSTLELSDFLKE